jgi:hypothetical protein
MFREGFGGGNSMFRRCLAACAVLATISTGAHPGGPFGSIHVGNWIGGAFRDDGGAFSHCAATATYANGIILVVGQNVSNTWLLSFASPGFKFNEGDTLPIDVTFDGRGCSPRPIPTSW